MNNNQFSSEEKSKQKIAQLKAKLQKEEIKLNQFKRKERNGQLIAFGILMEEMFKIEKIEFEQKWIDSAKRHLKDRNLNRALAGFERIISEKDYSNFQTFKFDEN